MRVMGTRSGEHAITVLECGGLIGPEAAGTLRAELSAAVDEPSRPILVDAGAAIAADGASLALLVSAAGTLAHSRPIALLASEELSAALTEWRFDTLWPVFTDREAAVGFLKRGV